MLLSSSDTRRTLMHLFLFTKSAQRELVSISTQSNTQLTFLALLPWFEYSLSLMISVNCLIKGNLVNRTLHSFPGGSREITLTFPLSKLIQKIFYAPICFFLVGFGCEGEESFQMGPGGYLLFAPPPPGSTLNQF